MTAAPQPKHSEGLIVIYGSQHLVEANSDWHGYSLDKFPYRCGISGISPAMLGRVAYVRLGSDGPYDGPCVVVDAVQADHAADSIEGRREIAEISYEQAARLDPAFVNGGRQGQIWFDLCPPDDRMRPAPQPFLLDQDYTHWPWVWDDFWPYQKQEYAIDCN